MIVTFQVCLKETYESVSHGCWNIYKQHWKLYVHTAPIRIWVRDCPYRLFFFCKNALITYCGLAHMPPLGSTYVGSNGLVNMYHYRSSGLVLAECSQGNSWKRLHTYCRHHASINYRKMLIRTFSIKSGTTFSHWCIFIQSSFMRNGCVNVKDTGSLHWFKITIVLVGIVLRLEGLRNSVVEYLCIIFRFQKYLLKP